MTFAVEPRWQRRPEGSNWGDFGADDQLGRLNLITDDVRLAAVREVREGRSLTLSLPLDYPGGEAADAARFGPRLFATELGGHQVYTMNLSAGDICCDDGVTMCLQYSTQWDSLAHWGQKFDTQGDGIARPVFYNGFVAGEHILGADNGGPRANKLGVENMAVHGVQGRAVLVDLARLYGTERRAIGWTELSQAITAQRVEVQPGDFLLLRTGYGQAVMAGNGHADEAVLARTGAVLDGTDPALLAWIADSGIAAICADNPAVEEFSFARMGHPGGLLPLHEHCIFKLGIHLGELWWLDELADHLHQVGQRPFLLTAPPLRLTGAAGSPVTPIATL